jgi:hypothetical protein
MFEYLSVLSITVNFFHQIQVNPDSVFQIRFHLIQIRIKHFRLKPDLDPDSIQIRDFLMTKNLKKLTAEKTTFYVSRQPSKENIQHFKT